ncbi:uncharacterized protein [Dysidea avara]|uniref:uncharacterized protein isoform X2 n=1 Tax=Dysidea avara TaxID=196820 RepID=UPI00332A1EE9
MAGDLSVKNVKEEATKLLNVILSCPVGARRTMYNCQNDHTYSKLLALQRKKTKLLKSCVEMEAELKLLKGDEVSVSSEDNIESIQAEINSTKSRCQHDVLLLESLKQSHCASRNMFKQPEGVAYDLKSTLEQQAQVVTELMRNVKEVQNLKGTIEQTRSQRSALQTECMKMMADLQSSDQDTTQPLEMSDDLKEVTSRAVLLQHTLQALIAGCTDWTASEELQELLLSLGTSPSLP